MTQRVEREQVAVAFGDVVSPVDAAALTGDFAVYLAGSLRAAVSTGIWGWFDDDLVFIRPWGFELDGIRVPEEGHPSIALAMFGEIVDELLASAPRPNG